MTSEGKKVAHPRFFSRDERKLARLHQALSRKQSGSSNRGKARAKLARASVRHTDRRLDFTHKLTTTLVNENQVICVESRNVKNLLRHRSRAKSISDAGWGELLRQLEYKAAWYGRSLVRIPQFFPSSKRCSNCGFTLADLPLNVRTWTCSQCGVHHDRDHNAAKNILAAGLAASACGEAARPKRETPVAARLSEAGSAGERSPALYALRGGSDSQESAALPDGG